MNKQTHLKTPPKPAKKKTPTASFKTFSCISEVDCASQKATVATSFRMGISMEQSRPSRSATKGRACIGPLAIGPLPILSIRGRLGIILRLSIGQTDPPVEEPWAPLLATSHGIYIQVYMYISPMAPKGRTFLSSSRSANHTSSRILRQSITLPRNADTCQIKNVR